MAFDTIFVDSVEGLPWSSFTEICDLEKKGRIFIGVYKDSSRQWLTESPDSPKKFKLILKFLLFMSSIGFLIPFIIFAWQYINWLSLILIISSMLSFMFGKSIMFKSMQHFYLVFGSIILITIIGFYNEIAIIWLLGLSIIGPWIFNEIQYKLSPYFVRKLVLKDEDIFRHFFEASELTILDLESKKRYLRATSKPLAPSWFYRTYK